VAALLALSVGRRSSLVPPSLRPSIAES
jgi:hypothetical protein